MIRKLLASAALLALVTGISPAAAQSDPPKSVVLVHGGFVDGSGWEGVYNILKKDGYQVTIVQNPTTSLADDVAATKRAIAGANGKVTLVGHSYGGAVITEAGNDPRQARLHHGLRARQRRVGFIADRKPGARRACAAHPASAGWLPAARQVEVRSLLCR